MNIIPHLPIYHRPPNKFLRYELRKFEVVTCTKVLTGVERVAIFLDKSNKVQEMTAQVMWDNI
jgi:hypothetical protein